MLKQVVHRAVHRIRTGFEAINYVPFRFVINFQVQQTHHYEL